MAGVMLGINLVELVVAWTVYTTVYYGVFS